MKPSYFVTLALHLYTLQLWSCYYDIKLNKYIILGIGSSVSGGGGRKKCSSVT